MLATSLRVLAAAPQRALGPSLKVLGGFAPRVPGGCASSVLYDFRQRTGRGVWLEDLKIFRDLLARSLLADRFVCCPAIPLADGDDQ